MFHLKAKSIGPLKQLLSAVSVLTDEVTLEMTPTGIHVRVMDPSRVAMVDAVWPKGIFEEYVCPEKIRVGVNLAELSKLLKRGAKDDSVEFEWSKDTGKFKVSIKNSSTSYSSAVSRSWTLPSLEPVEEEVPEPKLSFKTKVKMETSMFQQVMEDVTTVSNHVKVFVNNEGQMQIIGQGDLMSAAITLTKDQGLLEVDGAEELHVVSSNIFVTEIAKAVKPNSIMTLELATDMPLKFTFSGFLEEPTEDSRLVYYVAPRIETDNK